MRPQELHNQSLKLNPVLKIADLTSSQVNLRSKSLKSTCKEVDFSNVTGLPPAALLKNNTIIIIFQGF